MIFIPGYLAKSSPSQRLLPCFLQIAELRPDDPFPVASGDAKSGFPNRFPKRRHGEVLRYFMKLPALFRSNFHDESRCRFAEKFHHVGFSLCPEEIEIGNIRATPPAKAISAMATAKPPSLRS